MRARTAGVPLAFLVAACSPGSKEFTAQHREKAERLREQIVKLAEQADARPVKPGETCKPNRTLKFDPDLDAHDTDYLSVEAAKKGSRYESGDAETSRIRLQGPLRLYLIWLDTSHPWSTYNESVPEEAVTTVRRAENVKSVVFTKERWDPAIRELTVDWYLADLTTSQIVCAQRFTVKEEGSAGSSSFETTVKTRFADQMAMNLYIKVPK